MGEERELGGRGPEAPAAHMTHPPVLNDGNTAAARTCPPHHHLDQNNATNAWHGYMGISICNDM
jgi:hypothetical protein